MNDEQTRMAFEKKWEELKDKCHERQKLYDSAKARYLDLYGFKDEEELRQFLSDKKMVFDAGCGPGYKPAWFADLSPTSSVYAMDYTESAIKLASSEFSKPNLFFAIGDIADTPYEDDSFDFINCDQVLHHTEDPEVTLAELTRILRPGGTIALYVYRKKALPRELVDDYFRDKCKEMNHEELMDLSSQLTNLGLELQTHRSYVTVPDIPALGIKAGTYTIHDFIYWNFLKCYYNDSLGWDTSVITNYDWYSPSNAFRYTKEEFLGMTAKRGLTCVTFFEDRPSYSGRFVKNG